MKEKKDNPPNNLRLYLQVRFNSELSDATLTTTTIIKK